jgi:hypothetical protein
MFRFRAAPRSLWNFRLSECGSAATISEDWIDTAKVIVSTCGPGFFRQHSQDEPCNDPVRAERLTNARGVCRVQSPWALVNFTTATITFRFSVCTPNAALAHEPRYDAGQERLTQRETSMTMTSSNFPAHDLDLGAGMRIHYPPRETWPAGRPSWFSRRCEASSGDSAVAPPTHHEERHHPRRAQEP